MVKLFLYIKSSFLFKELTLEQLLRLRNMFVVLAFGAVLQLIYLQYDYVFINLDKDSRIMELLQERIKADKEEKENPHEYYREPFGPIDPSMPMP